MSTPFWRIDRSHYLGAIRNLPKIVKLAFYYPYSPCQPCESRAIAVATHKKIDFHYSFFEMKLSHEI